MGDDTSNLPKEIRIRYRKTPDYRVVHADGARVSVTPQLEIQIAFFTALLGFPTVEAVQAVGPDGNLGPVVEPDAEFAIDREVGNSIIVNPLVAIEVIKALQTTINQLKETSPSEQVRAALEQAQAPQS